MRLLRYCSLPWRPRNTALQQHFTTGSAVEYKWETWTLYFPPEEPRAQSLITGADNPASHYSWFGVDIIQDLCPFTKKVKIFFQAEKYRTDKEQ